MSNLKIGDIVRHIYSDAGLYWKIVSFHSSGSALRVELIRFPASEGKFCAKGEIERGRPFFYEKVDLPEIINHPLTAMFK